MNSFKITQAIILSAGLGTRLRPLTDGIPKVMVPILGKPLLLYHIEQLKKHGITDIFINLHYLPDIITDFFGDGSKFGVHITYELEKEKILGTAGGIKSFERKIKDNFFVIYGDIFSLVDYSKMSEAFFQKENALGMEIIGDTEYPHDSDVVEVDAASRFLKIHTKPHTSLPESYKSMRAIFIMNKEIFNFIPSKTYYEIDHQSLPAVLAAGNNFYGYECDDFLEDVGTPERYYKTIEYLKKFLSF